MKILSWNCRGLGNHPSTVRALRKILQEEQPDIIFLMETKLKTDEMRKINVQKLFYEGCFVVDCEVSQRSRRGGLCMLWKIANELSLSLYSLHHISCHVGSDSIERRWTITGVYCWPETSNRDQTCQLLGAVHNDTLNAWMCIGDFNEILWSFEKKGGNAKSKICMNLFRDALRWCNLQDLGYEGFQYTWSNGRKNLDNVMERLDRALSNEEWKTLFSYYKVRHLPRIKSDHAPIVLNL